MSFNVLEKIGFSILVIPVVALAFLIGALASLWVTWWFYPIWAWAIVPLGAPPISFWHFWVLLTLLRSRTPELQTKPLQEKPKDWSDYLGYTLVVILAPIVFWALAKWALDR